MLNVLKVSLILIGPRRKISAKHVKVILRILQEFEKHREDETKDENQVDF